MRNITWWIFLVLVTFLGLSNFINVCEARGGRGRGGGSFGGIFGGWRKYKKPASGGNSRRTTNGSPMHTTVTKSLSNNGASYSSLGNAKQSKPLGSYPKQQMPSNYNHYHGYYGSGGPGAAHLPTGSAYYPNTAAMPPGAIYYGQAPMRSSSGAGDFLFGMMAGHVASNLLFRPRHHVTHVYQQNPDHNPTQHDPKVIVINNGELTAMNATESLETPTSSSSSSSEEDGEDGTHYWPTDSDTPLAPFNASVTPADALQTGKQAIFQRTKFNNFRNTQMPQIAHHETTANSNEQSSKTTKDEKIPPPAPAPAPAFNGGIICMPVVLNETDPTDPSKVQQVDKIVCFPAPPPPVQASMENPDVSCVIRTFVEADPNDPSQTIEVPKEICTTTTTTAIPPQVAGEIGENVASTTSEIEKTATTENEQEVEKFTNAETSTKGKSLRTLTTNDPIVEAIEAAAAAAEVSATTA